MVGFDHVDDGLDDRGWGEELATVVRALLGKLGEEIFVDPPEHVARCGAQSFRVEHAHHFFEDAALEARVVLRQLAGERRESVFDRLHRGVERCAEIAVLGRLQDHVEPRALGQIKRAAARKVGLD